MSVGTRLGLVVVAAVLGLAALELDLAGPQPDLTRAALRQMDSGDAAAEELRAADLAKNWKAVAWPAGVLCVAGLLFWDDLGRWWAGNRER